MGLHLDPLVAQIEGMVSRIKDTNISREKHLNTALAALKLHEPALARLRTRIAAASKEHRTTWLAALPGDSLVKKFQPSPVPADFYVLASDGSHIAADRHYSVHCFLLNIGLIELTYGSKPDARLSSKPSLYFTEEHIVITPPEADGKPQLIEGPLLGIKRSVEECRALAEAAVELPGQLPVVALLDGSLILWSLSENTYPRFIISSLLQDGMLRHLSTLRDITRLRQISLASYISFPRSTEVVNAIRLAICPHELVDCDRHCPPQRQEHDCDGVSGVIDRDIFNRLLAPGERSAVFTSLSNITTGNYGPHQIHFFYIKLDDEVGRIEVPAWVAADSNLVDLTHNVILDQCRRGQGYPVALSEAHEQAVVTGSDREQFWRLVEMILNEKGITLEKSLKSSSKRSKSL